MKTILSKDNEVVKNAKKLQKKKYRKLTNTFLVEGFHLVEEASRAGFVLETIFVVENVLEKFKQTFDHLEEKVILVSENVLKEISETSTSQGIVAIVRMKTIETREAVQKWLLLDAVQDPGNVGTIIRTADAFGFGIVLGQGCADIYNSKTLRSMQGSNFHIPIYEKDLAVAIEELKQEQVAIFATALNQEAKSYLEIAEQKMAIIVGNEGNGVSQEFIQTSDAAIFIPMKGKAESLNVAIASGILMAHFS